MFLIVISLIGIAFLNSSCQKQTTDSDPAIVFQGPVNPNFELPDGWLITQTEAYIGGNEYYGFSRRLTGTGFMPTKGLWYMNLNGGSPDKSADASCSVYQDNVNFSKSKTLTFDYSYSVNTYGVTGTVTIEILFTAIGTQTLWSKTFVTPAVVVVPPIPPDTSDGGGAGISMGTSLTGNTGPDPITKITNWGGGMLVGSLLIGGTILADMLVKKPFLHKAGTQTSGFEDGVFVACIIAGTGGYVILNNIEKSTPGHYYSVDGANKDAQTYNKKLKEKLGLPESYDIK